MRAHTKHFLLCVNTKNSTKNKNNKRNGQNSMWNEKPEKI